MLVGGVLVSTIVAAVVVVAVLILLFWVSWRVAEPDEAMIISGFRSGGHTEVGESMGFRIVTGRGTLAFPALTKVRRLSLEAHESQIVVPCVSQQNRRSE